MASQSQKEQSRYQERYKRSSSPEERRSPRGPGKPLRRGRRYEWQRLARGHPAAAGDAQWKAVGVSFGLGHRENERVGRGRHPAPGGCSWTALAPGPGPRRYRPPQLSSGPLEPRLQYRHLVHSYWLLSFHSPVPSWFSSESEARWLWRKVMVQQAPAALPS